jgi:hypothetical protein
MYRANKTEKDVSYILDNLRIEDLEELKALWGENWKEQTLKNIMETEFSVMLGKTKDKDVPVVMGGVWRTDPNDEGVGCIWMLGTDNIEKHQICLLRELRKEIEKFDQEYWITYNIIYKENFKAKNWLQWLGFKFDNPKPEGIEVPEGFEFFYRLRPVKGLGE